MPRPRMRRRIEHSPRFSQFRPVSGREFEPQADDIVLLSEELEAIRLKDLEGLEQAQAAERMGVSRPTFQRILRAGRRKIAEALINGRGLRVDRNAPE